MKKLIFVIFLLLVSCEKDPTIEGEWKATTLHSFESYPFFNIYIDTNINTSNLSLILNEGVAYTIVDGEASPYPILGFQYENVFSFPYEYTGDTLRIGGEFWDVLVFTNKELILQNITQYGIVGNQVRTITFKK